MDDRRQSKSDPTAAFPFLFQSSGEFALESSLNCKRFLNTPEPTFLEEVANWYLSYCEERTYTSLQVLLKEGYVLDSIMVCRSIVDTAVKFMLIAVSNEEERAEISSALSRQFPSDQIRLRGLYKRILDEDTADPNLSFKALNILAEEFSHSKSPISRNEADGNIRVYQFQEQFKKLKERAQRRNLKTRLEPLELFYKSSSNILHGNVISLILAEIIGPKPVNQWNRFHFSNAATVCGVIVLVWYLLEFFYGSSKPRLQQRYEMARELLKLSGEISEHGIILE